MKASEKHRSCARGAKAMTATKDNPETQGPPSHCSCHLSCYRVETVQLHQPRSDSSVARSVQTWQRGWTNNNVIPVGGEPRPVLDVTRCDKRGIGGKKAKKLNTGMEATMCRNGSVGVQFITSGQVLVFCFVLFRQPFETRQIRFPSRGVATREKWRRPTVDRKLTWLWTSQSVPRLWTRINNTALLNN